MNRKKSKKIKSGLSEKTHNETVDNKQYQSLDSILKGRFHGAVNIKGIRFQILYSIYQSLDEYKLNSNFKLQLEGLEDLDLKGLKTENKYMQVKTSEQPWNWAKYKDIFKSFYEIYEKDKQAKFIVAANFKH